MSGHSKWQGIKHRKGLADAKRATVFTKFANAITLAAREGGGDPEFNFKLRLVVDKAKMSNMPKENIDRAIKKGTGELEGVQLAEIVYEGFGPHNVAVVVEVVTDNRNRIVSELKHAFSRHGGGLGVQNSVMWNFEHLGVVRFSQEKISPDQKEMLELDAIDVGANDVSEQGEYIVVTTKIPDFQKVQEALSKKGYEVADAGIEFVAKDTQKLTEEQMESLATLLDALDDLGDVTNIYTNV